MWLDKGKNIEVKSVYQTSDTSDRYFLDELLTTEMLFQGLDDQADRPTIGASYDGHGKEVISIKNADGFTRDHTLFLIDIMRQYVSSENENLPKSLSELENRIKLGKGKKKIMWLEVAKKMTKTFQLTFDPQKVARKWQTLVDAFKKVVDNNGETGRGTMKFQFYEEMKDLIGSRHDVELPVTGTADGVNIKRPEEVETAARPSGQTSPIISQTSRKRKRINDNEDILQVFKDSEDAADRRQVAILEQMDTFQKSFESLFGKLLEKL